jgi:tetratricopeptide (TPR) repeat protein
MTATLDELISKAKELAKVHDEEGAMSLATELVQQYPQEMRVWSLRAYLHGLQGNYTEAVADLTRAIEINPAEPHYFYSRGRYRFGLSDNPAAIEDFSKGLDLCDRYKSDYYREELHFWRAEALLRLGKKHEALSDLAHVSDDFRSWTDKLRTKAELLADCARLS